MVPGGRLVSVRRISAIWSWAFGSSTQSLRALLIHEAAGDLVVCRFNALRFNVNSFVLFDSQRAKFKFPS